MPDSACEPVWSYGRLWPSPGATGSVWGRSLSSTRVALVLAAVIAVAAGCGASPFGQATPVATARPSARPALPAVAPLAEWQRKGATEVPPASVLAVSTAGIVVENQTDGQVTDADAATWAVAIRRTYSLTLWAMARLQTDFLVKSGLSTAPNQVFGSNLVAIQRARTAGATQVDIVPFTITRLILRPVPAAVRQQFTNGGFTWSPYAFYVGEQGPFTATVTSSGGQTLSVQQPLAAGAGASELIGGQLLHDPVLGDVWVAGTDWNCETAGSRAAFGTLCSSS